MLRYSVVSDQARFAREHLYARQARTLRRARSADQRLGV